MKKSPLPEILLALLAVLALLTAWYSVSYRSAMKHIAEFQPRAEQYARSQAVLNNFFGELVEYGKKNPAVEPILQQAGFRPASSVPATTSSTVKAVNH